VSESLRVAGDFGGEPSGAWVFPGSSLCPDGIFAAAMLVSIANQKKLSSLADDIRQYPMRRGSISGKIALERLEPGLVAALHPQSVQRIDGIKLVFNDGWALVRQSGTEPMIRLTVEATTEPRLQSIYERVENLIMESIRK